jgi:hypothetical protein
MPHDYAINSSSVIGVEITPFREIIGDRSRFFTSPGVECRHESSLVYQTDLQRAHSEEEIAVGGKGSYGENSPETLSRSLSDTEAASLDDHPRSFRGPRAGKSISPAWLIELTGAYSQLTVGLP